MNFSNIDELVFFAKIYILNSIYEILSLVLSPTGSEKFALENVLMSLLVLLFAINYLLVGVTIELELEMAEIGLGLEIFFPLLIKRCQ